MDKLINLRNKIDELDNRLLNLLQERFDVVEEVGIIKKKFGMKPLDKTRWLTVLENSFAQGEQCGLRREFVQTIMNAIHNEALLIEEKLKMNHFKIDNLKIGILGYGQFGQLLQRILISFLPQIKVSIYARTSTNDKSISNDLKKIIDDVDIIIPAVPINQFEIVIKQIAPLMREGHILVDVCSVKEYPAHIMKKYISPDVTIIATHPLFGPNSLFDNDIKTVKGNKIVINKIQGDAKKYLQVQAIFESIGLTLIEMSAREHDVLQAKSQFFAHTIKSLVLTMNLNNTLIDTPSSELLFEGLNKIGNNHQLFRDMIYYNSHCKALLQNIQKEIEKLVNNNK